MFRYYLAEDEHMPKPGENYGHWHAIHLTSHGKSGHGWNAIVMHDVHVKPHPEWVAFPRVVDAKTPIKERLDHTLLADLGLTGDETTLEATDKLAAVWSVFEHP